MNAAVNYRTEGRVLIVEDNLYSVKLYNRIFSDLISIRFDIAESGREAIRLFETNEYTHLLTDLGLPDYDGIQLKKDLDKLELSMGYKSVALDQGLN